MRLGVEALAVRAPLRISFECDHAEFREPRHVLHVALLIRVHSSVEHEPVRAFHFVHDVARRNRLFDRERLAFASRRHEAQHHEIGIGVQEHILDELLARQALQIAALARLGLFWRVVSARRKKKEGEQNEVC